MNLLQSNNNSSSLFGQGNSGGGSGLFGSNNNAGSGSSGGLFGTPIFGAQQNTGSNLMGSGNNGLFSSPNKGLGGGTGSLLGGFGGTKGTMQVKYEPQKNREGLYIQSITATNECKNKTLDELRAEDYAFIKAGQIPDDVKARLEQNYKNQSSGGGGGLGGLGSGMGGGTTSSLFGSGNAGGGGGLFSSNTQGGSSGGGGGLPSLSLQRGNVIPGATGTGTGTSGGGGGLFGNTGTQQGGGGGGLFGGSSGSGGGGLFGNTGTQQGGGGGGLFGQQKPQGGGLFGSSGTSQGGGLFGNTSGNTQQQGGGGGLFGGSGAGGGGGGLFGNKPAGTGQSGGLFGSTTTGQSGGLFGNKPAGTGQSGGLFSQGTAAGGGGGGGGLFSQSGAGGGGGGLFSQSGAGGGGGGLFSQGTAAGGGGGLFSQGSSLFGQKPGQQAGTNPHLFPTDMYSAFLANIDPSWYPKLLENMPSLAGPGSPKNKDKEKEKEKEVSTEMKQSNGLYVPYRPQEINLEKKDQGYRGKKTLNEMAMSLGNTLSLNQKDRTVAYSGLNSGYNPFEKIGTTKIQENDRGIADSLSLKRRLGPHSIVKRMNEDMSYDKNASFIDNHLEIMLRPKAVSRSFYTDTPSRSSRSVLDDLNDSRLSIGSKKKKNIYNDSVVVNLSISFGGKNEEGGLMVRIFNGSSILDLKRKALEKLAKESSKLVGIVESQEELEDLAKRSNIFVDCRVLNDGATLLQAGITQENNHAFLYIDVPQYVPKLTKEGYYTIPPLEELADMSKEQMKSVEGFTIGNQWGKIEFLGETDLSGVDLDELVILRHGEAEVYPDDKFPTEQSKPPRGQKLNKPAIITLYNCHVKKRSKDKKGSTGKEEAPEFETLGYNKETGEYKIRVQHFTKYTFDTDNSEGEEEDRKEEYPPRPYQPPMRGDIRTPGAQDDFLEEKQDQIRKPGQRRGPESMEIQKEEMHGESLGSESDRLQKIFESKIPQDNAPINEEEIFESSDEDQETYSQQFRKRHAGMPIRRILKGNQDRIIMEPQARDEEMDEFEEELAKEEREPEEVPGEKFDEETAFSQSKLTELLSIADGFSAHTRDRLQTTSLVKNMTPKVKDRCQNTLNCLELLNKRVMGKTDQLINVREKQFYLNRSFRVGWTRDGFASIGVGRTISIHKVIVHKELGCHNEEENGAFNFERYKRNLSFVVKSLYEPLLKALVNNSMTMDGMEDLSLNESRREAGRSKFLKFPEPQGLAYGLMEYVETVSTKQIWREDSDESRVSVFGELRLRDVEILSLLNTLFGRCELDLWKYAIGVEKGEVTDEEKDELLKKLDRNIEGDRLNMFTRKHGLSKWLERKAVQFVATDLDAAKERGNGPSVSEEILLYLSGRQLKRATDFCNKKELNRLAVQLSMLTTNHPTKEAFRQQLQEWTQTNQVQDITVREVYQFLSGDTSVVNLYEWIRFFGVELWYLAKPNLSIAEVVREFYQTKLKRNDATYKTAVSIFSNPYDNKDKKQKNLELGFLLVALYAEHPEFNLQDFLNPYTYTSDCIDVKFLWIIAEFLSNNRSQGQRGGSRVGSMSIESSQDSQKRNEFRYRVLRGFCYQMELLGLWDYAVYAILIASPEVISEGGKKRYVREIIQRNYKDSEILSADLKSKGIKKKGRKKELLVEILGVEHHLLHESKAYKYLYSFAYTKAAKHLLKCGSWRDAHTVLCQHLAPVAVLNSLAYGRNIEEGQSSLTYLGRYLQELGLKKQVLANWEKEGYVLSRYLEELNSNEQAANNVTVDELVVLTHRVEHFEKTQKSLIGKIMIDKIRRDLASIIMKRTSDVNFAIQKNKILDCIEKLDIGIKEDKTSLVLQFIEKDASC